MHPQPPSCGHPQPRSNGPARLQPHLDACTHARKRASSCDLARPILHPTGAIDSNSSSNSTAFVCKRSSQLRCSNSAAFAMAGKQPGPGPCPFKYPPALVTGLVQQYTSAGPTALALGLPAVANLQVPPKSAARPRGPAGIEPTRPPWAAQDSLSRRPWTARRSNPGHAERGQRSLQ